MATATVTPLARKIDHDAYALLNRMFMRNLNEGQYIGVQYYIDGGFKDLNYCTDEKREQYATLRNHLDTALTQEFPLPALYRGTSRERLAHLNVGDTYTFDGYMSTSVDPNQATQFASAKTNPAILIVNGVTHNFGAVSDQTWESEILLAHGTTYEVTRITDNVTVSPELADGFYGSDLESVMVVEVTAI